MAGEVNGVGKTISWFFRPYGVDKNNATEEGIKNYRKEKPGFLKGVTPAETASLGVLVVGGILAAFGLSNDSSGMKTSGGAITVAGILAMLITGFACHWKAPKKEEPKAEEKKTEPPKEQEPTGEAGTKISVQSAAAATTTPIPPPTPPSIPDPKVEVKAEPVRSNHNFVDLEKASGEGALSREDAIEASIRLVKTSKEKVEKTKDGDKEEALNGLKRSLTEGIPEVRLYAGEALIELKEENSVIDFIKNLDANSDIDKRIKQLLLFQLPEARAIELLKNETPVCELLTEALMNVDLCKKAGDLLIKAGHENELGSVLDREVKKSKPLPQEVNPNLIRSQKRADEINQRKMQQYIERYGEENLPISETLLAQGHAVKALIESGKADEAKLDELLTHSEPYIRSKACEASLDYLKKSKGKFSEGYNAILINKLIEHLEENKELNVHYEKGIYQPVNKTLIGVLRDRLEAVNTNECTYLVNELKKVGSKEAFAVIEHFMTRKEVSPNLKLYAANELGLDSRTDIQTKINSLRAARLAASKINDASAKETVTDIERKLSFHLPDPTDHETNIGIVRVLSSSGDEEVKRAIFKCLDQVNKNPTRNLGIVYSLVSPSGENNPDGINTFREYIALKNSKPLTDIQRNTIAKTLKVIFRESHTSPEVIGCILEALNTSDKELLRTVSRIYLQTVDVTKLGGEPTAIEALNQKVVGSLLEVKDSTLLDYLERPESNPEEGLAKEVVTQVKAKKDDEILQRRFRTIIANKLVKLNTTEGNISAKNYLIGLLAA